MSEQPKRILVTGATGFIGRHCLALLKNDHHDVHATYREGKTNTFATWHQADLLNPNDLKRVIDTVQPTHLLHLAWYAVHGLFWASPENLRWVEATLNLLRLFKEHGGQRAVLAGTCVEYDWNYGYCHEERTPRKSSSLYGVSKASLCDIAVKYAAQTGLSLTWGRIFFPFGPGENANRLVPSVVRSALAGQPIRCTHGQQIRDFMYVGDYARAFVALLDSTVTGAINIASGLAKTIREMVRQITLHIPNFDERLLQFGAIDAPANDAAMVVADVSRLRDELKWQPMFDLSDAIQHTINSWDTTTIGS